MAIKERVERLTEETKLRWKEAWTKMGAGGKIWGLKASLAELCGKEGSLGRYGYLVEGSLLVVGGRSVEGGFMELKERLLSAGEMVGWKIQLSNKIDNVGELGEMLNQSETGLEIVVAGDEICEWLGSDEVKNEVGAWEMNGEMRTGMESSRTAPAEGRWTSELATDWITGEGGFKGWNLHGVLGACPVRVWMTMSPLRATQVTYYKGRGGVWMMVDGKRIKMEGKRVVAEVE